MTKLKLLPAALISLLASVPPSENRRSGPQSASRGHAPPGEIISVSEDGIIPK